MGGGGKGGERGSKVTDFVIWHLLGRKFKSVGPILRCNTEKFHLSTSPLPLPPEREWPPSSGARMDPFLQSGNGGGWKDRWRGRGAKGPCKSVKRSVLIKTNPLVEVFENERFLLRPQWER